ncbi:hypothetical protein Scep_024041 [Stephania cephalantha]|uniref:Uncharacterized protein n=1 Tax=Stephania cephalantha TaxID=152367 RepID=A0AAP0EVT8_9MAGN
MHRTLFEICLQTKKLYKPTKIPNSRHKGAPHPPNPGCPDHYRRVVAPVNEPNPSQPASDAPEMAVAVLEGAFSEVHAHFLLALHESLKLREPLNDCIKLRMSHHRLLGRADTGISISSLPLAM